ncbi:leucyl/phenylalanyl-tRNA--protein transferase [Zhouia spongiae]|uniref:leucyl/phenylalanyl-tRNA--protein transferase n=1 Tax=Zhouia spongiae TaxID=2202721 RepID=UPI003BFA7A3C
MIRSLSEKIEFPDPEEATSEGLLAFGGDLSHERLVYAYKNGIFPWFDEGSVILWWCPDPRMVLYPEDLKVSKSMRSILKKNVFKVTFNKDFEGVINNCASMRRTGQDDTWITEDMKKAYMKLYELGYAMSVEVWKDESLVGGVYGVDLGDVFCGESMFARESNASKAGFITLVKHLRKKNYKLIDCQVYTDHLASLGAVEIPRNEFLKIIQAVKG